MGLGWDLQVNMYVTDVRTSANFPLGCTRFARTHACRRARKPMRHNVGWLTLPGQGGSDVGGRSEGPHFHGPETLYTYTKLFLLFLKYVIIIRRMSG